MNKKVTARAARPKKKIRVKAAAETCVACGETLDISQAATLHASLTDALAGRRPVTLDVSSVAQADTAALQVLCAFVRDAHAANLTVTWRQPSEIFCRTANLMGLNECLGLQSAS